MIQHLDQLGNAVVRQGEVPHAEVLDPPSAAGDEDVHAHVLDPDGEGGGSRDMERSQQQQGETASKSRHARDSTPPSSGLEHDQRGEAEEEAHARDVGRGGQEDAGGGGGVGAEALQGERE